MTPAHTEIERLALLATQGEWVSQHHGVFDESGRTVANVSATRGRYEPEADNRNFIAACNPAAILSLLADIRRLEEKVKTVHNSAIEECELLLHRKRAVIQNDPSAKNFLFDAIVAIRNLKR